MLEFNKSLYIIIICLMIFFTAQPSIKYSYAQEMPRVSAEAFFQITHEQMEDPVRPQFTARLMSQRFVFQYLAASPVREPYIFQETIDQEESTLREQTNGRVTITAFKAYPDSAAQIWQFNANGRGGDFLYGEVYRLNQSFCCDMSPRSVYYDLHTGNPLFSSTTPPLVVSDSQNFRYIGYDDGVGGEMPVEMQEDRSITGLLTYSGRHIATQKLAIMVSTDEEYRQQEFSISINGQPLAVRNGVSYLHAFAHPEQFSFADELLLKVTLFCRCDTDESIEIPIANDGFLIDRAIVSSGISLKLL
jgi:hypothetical protein